MSPLYLLLLCFAVASAGKLKDDLSNIVSDIGNLSTKGLSLGGSLELSSSPKLTVSTPELGLSASLSSGQSWLDAVRKHINSKVANLHAALNEIENAHSNLNTVAVPLEVESKVSPVGVPVKHQDASPVTVSVEQEPTPVTVVEHHNLNPLEVTVEHDSAPVTVLEHQNLPPKQVEAESKVEKLDVSKSGANEEVLNVLCRLKPALCDGGNYLGLASDLKVNLPHFSVGGDISFNGDDYLHEIASLGQNLKAKLKKLNPLTGIEGLLSDSENKLNKLRAFVNLHALKLGNDEGLVNILCKLHPTLCSVENDLGFLLKPKKTSLSLDLKNGLASLLESLKGKGLSRDGDHKEVVPVSQLVPVAQHVPVNQAVPVAQPVAVSQPISVSQPVTVSQDVPVSQYSVGIPVSVHIPELQGVPVSQLASVSQSVPVSQYSVGVPVSQYNVGVPVSVRIPELHSVPVRQEVPGDVAIPVNQDVPVNVGLPVSLGGSLQASLGSGLSGGFEASLNNGEHNNGVLISSGAPLYAYDGILPHDEVKLESDYSRRSGSVRRPNTYGIGRRSYGAPIPMAGVNYGRRA